MKRLFVIAPLLLPPLAMAQTAEVTFTVSGFTWDYRDEMGTKSGTLNSDPAASTSIDLNLQGKNAIAVKWQAPDCKAYALTLPSNIGNDLEFIPTVDEGGGAYSAPYSGIPDESLAMTQIISTGVGAPAFSEFSNYSAYVASNNNSKVFIQSAFDSAFSDPAGTVYKFRSLKLTGSVNSTLNVSNRNVRPQLRLQMTFDNSVTSDPGAPMTIVDACPGAPTNLVATPLEGAAQISFQAGADNDSAITNYAYSVDGGAFSPLSSPDSQSPITIPNLTAGQTYSVVLRAINAIGEGADSTAINVSPHPDSDGDGVIDPRDAYPNDPTRSVMPVPLIPALGLFMLAGLLGILGVRRLRF